MTTYLTADQLGYDETYGVQRYWIGEDGDAVAITEDTRRGLAAVHAMARNDLGKPATTSRVTKGWARFTASASDLTEWEGHFCDRADDGALPVVIAHEVGEVYP